MNEKTDEYEAPKVEVVETEDAPAVTAAGGDTTTLSDRDLKQSVRELEEASDRIR